MDKCLTIVAIIFGTAMLTLVLMDILEHVRNPKDLVLLLALILGQFSLTCGLRSIRGRQW